MLSIVNASWDARTHTHTTKNSQDASQYIMPVMGHGVLVFFTAVKVLDIGFTS